MDFLGLFTLQPQAPFISLGVWMTWFSGVLLMSIVLMVFLRLKRIRKEYRDVLSRTVSGLFGFACAGYLLIIFRLSSAPVLSMRLLYVVWFACFFWYLYKRYEVMLSTMKLVQRKVANKEKARAEATPTDPYLAAYQKGKKKR